LYLSRVKLDVEKRDTMRALAQPNLIHGAVEQGFRGERGRNIWRIDFLNNYCYLLVLSQEKPNFTHLVEQFGFSNSEPLWETKNYDLLLERLKEGQIWRFRLCANPTRSSFTEKCKKTGRGKIFAHVTTEQQKEWLLKRAGTSGFLLEESGFDVVHSQWKRFRKGGGGRVTLKIVTFEGILTISNVELFKRALLTGIGRAKSYGCGMLTIAGCGGVKSA
jgi:CRISPR system Cascade subunit CasE